MAQGSQLGGCLNCYAARLSARNLPELRSPTTGQAFARILDSGPRWTGAVELIEKQLRLPLHWRKPKKIFVNSMSDLFHEALSDEDISRVFAVMALCPQHTFQVLTKRPKQMFRYMTNFRHLTMDYLVAAYSLMGISAPDTPTDWPLKNVWLGVSVENQATADARIPVLLQTPAAKRFISYEPAIDPVEFSPFLAMYRDGFMNWRSGNKLSWVIVGGESGPGARPFEMDWALDTIRQCREAGVACFVKQMGSVSISPGNGRIKLKDRSGADPSEWPERLRVQEFPN